MSRRPTKEFWKEIFPKVYKHYKHHDHERAAAVTASIWYHKLNPATKARFNLIRAKRETHGTRKYNKRMHSSYRNFERHIPRI